MQAERVRTRSKVHAIVGPTGVGKSAAATELASATGAPVLVADRIQCFTDLAVTTSRATDENAHGVHRIWLSDRTIGDGDIPPDDAVDMVVTRLGQLVARHRLVVVEGGSISIMLGLAERIDDLPFPVTIQVMRITDPDGYRTRLRARARQMLLPDRYGRSLLTEFAAVWAVPAQRVFLAALPGPDRILDWCERHAIEPGSVDRVAFAPAMLDALSRSIGDRHAEHGFLQDQIFSEVFD
ncbi:isopentenyl transferase family protein [Streptomyces sp. NPDC091280]|uniref:isopentenyl transferase family protein n=1 Tax=unclassified Streptomyces TaxID=2593676 RepID=UPI00382A4362